MINEKKIIIKLISSFLKNREFTILINNNFVFCKLLKIVIDKELKFVYDYFSMVEISC